MNRVSNPSFVDKFFTHSNDVLAVLDFNFAAKRLNPAWEKTFGLARQELESAPWVEFLHLEDRLSLTREVEKLKGGAVEFATKQARFRCADGSYKWMSWSVTAALEKKLYFIIGRDIGEHKRQDDAAQKNQQFLNSIVESIPDMIFVKDAQSLRFVRFNRAGEDLLGYGRDELIGKSVHDVFPKEEADALAEKDRDVLAAGRPEEIAEESVHTHDKGLRILHTKKIPIFNETGQPQYLLGISEDITERRQAEEALRRSEELFRLISENVEDFIAVVDLEGRSLYHNPAYVRFLGEGEPLPGADFFRDAHPEDRERMRRLFYRTVRAAAGCRAEYRVVLKGKRVRILESELNVLQDRQGRASRAVIVSRDITGQKRAEEKLKYRLEMEKLLSAVSTQFVRCRPEDADRSIHEGIKAIGEFAGVDRGYIYLFYDAGSRMDNTHEWCGEGMEPQIQHLKGLLVDHFAWLAGKIKNLEIAHVPRVDELPPDALTEKEEFSAQGVQSFIAIPMVYGGDVIGFLGLDSARRRKTWSEEDIRLLQLAAEIFAGAVARHRTEAEIRNLAKFPAECPNPVLRVHEDGMVAYSNIPGLALLRLWKCRVGQAVSAPWRKDVLESLKTGIKREIEVESGGRFFSMILAPVVGARYVYLYAADVTESKKARENLQIFRNLIDQSNDAIFVVEPSSGRFLDVNDKACRTLLYAREELLRMKVPDIEALLPDEAAWQRHVAEVKEQGCLIFEGSHLRKDGVRFPVEVSIKCATQDTKSYLVAVARDLTERKKLEKRVLQAEKMSSVGQLAAGIAHEINNPIGIILGFAQGALKRLDEVNPLALPLKTIEREAKRCKNTVDNLLVFSRHHETPRETLNLEKEISTALALVETQARLKAVQVIREFKSPDLRIRGDGNQIQRMVINLCSNAIDAMPEGGRLGVAAEMEGAPNAGWAVLRVSDTGAGMSEELQKHIFEPFYTTKDSGKGTGLGLSIVYEIVGEHKGTIEVQSAVGRGTTFTIRLPASAP